MNEEKPDRYLFVTSQSLSRTQKDTLCNELAPWIRNPANLLAQIDLNELLGRHSGVERQHFKLWLASTGVLERIIQSGLWARSEALIEDVSDRVKLYVRTPKYEVVRTQLDNRHVVVLTGVPGVGKSLLAEMVLLGHWHDGWQVVSVSEDIDEGWSSWRPGERQIFYYDDFLGQTDFSERGSKNEDSRIVRFMDRVASDASKRLVMTTRSQILNQAALKREVIARGRFQLWECVVEVSDYGALEKAKILYNHLYFSSLSRRVIRDYIAGKHYWEVVRHPNFSPRVVELVLRRGSQTAQELASELARTLDRPVDLWGTLFATVLSETAQRIVLVLATFPVWGVDPEALRLAARGSARPIDYTHALRALEGTFIKIEYMQRPMDRALRTVRVSYANPSVRDFVLATLDAEPDYVLDLINQASSAVQILSLFRYAGSMSGAAPKFPAIAEVLSSNRELIEARIADLAAEGLQVAPSRKGRQNSILNDLLGPIAELLPLARRITPDILPGVLDSALMLFDQLSYSPILETLVYLTEALLFCHSEDVTEVQDLVHSLVHSWGESLSTAEEVEAFAEFLEINSTLLTSCLGLQDVLMLYGPNALRSDIDNIGDNRHDEYSDLEWLDGIENTANKLGLTDELRGDIELARQSTYNHYADESSYGDSPTSGAGYLGSSTASVGDVHAEIESVFQQLS